MTKKRRFDRFAMIELCQLYQYADAKHIDVDYYPMRQIVSAAFPDNCICMDVDKMADSAEEKVHLAHELGHIATDGFYTVTAPMRERRRIENRANSWAIRKLVPLAELDRLAGNGYIEPWDVAEYFGVTQDFAARAIEYYVG